MTPLCLPDTTSFPFLPLLWNAKDLHLLPSFTSFPCITRILLQLAPAPSTTLKMLLWMSPRTSTLTLMLLKPAVVWPSSLTCHRWSHPSRLTSRLYAPPVSSCSAYCTFSEPLAGSPTLPLGVWWTLFLVLFCSSCSLPSCSVLLCSHQASWLWVSYL